MGDISDIIRRSFKSNDDKRDEGLITPDDIVRYDDICYGADSVWQVLDIYLPKAFAESRVKKDAKTDTFDSEIQEIEKREKLPVILIGSVIYAFGINVFLKPMHIYSGGFMGICQLIQTLLQDYAHVLPADKDITGILYWILNAPALAYAWKKMRRRFFYKSIFSVTAITIVMGLIPIPAKPILEDYLGNAIIAGLVCGTGIGVILRMGAADGGLDLVGMIVISLSGKSSVGQIGMYVNLCLYTIYLFLFDVKAVIYCIIYSAFNSIACDRLHTQNINAQIMVISSLKDTTAMEVEIMGRLNRGITRIRAEGAFTNEERIVLLIMVSKYEVNRLRGLIRRHDPRAFIVVNEGVNVDGHFIKKLT